METEADRQAAWVEDVGVLLSDMGIPRMGAKAFAALITAPEEGLTARELAERVSASPAAISGAMKLLTQFRMVRRSRRPGERADRYTIGENFWEQAIQAEMQAYGPMIDTVQRGLDELDLSPAARDRMIETRDFLAFFTEEMPRLIERWEERRA
jgi:DNA-binding transcriptional regulator GbsR (MarR family)